MRTSPAQQIEQPVTGNGVVSLGAAVMNGPMPRVTMWPVDPARRGHDALFAKVVDIAPGDGHGSGAGAAEMPSVVFLHGLVGLNDHWEEVVRLVRARARCVLFELPLLALSGDQASIDGVTRLTERFLREHLDRPAVLVGNSFGGHVALRLAIQHGERVRGLVLAGSSGMIEKSIVADVQIRPSRAWVARKIGELFHDQSKMRESDLDRAFEELNQRSRARAMVKLSRSARRDVLRDSVGLIKVPTLLIWGRQDVVTPPEAAERFHALIAGSRLVWFDRCGHVPMIEAPEAFAGEVLSFLDSLCAAPASVPHAKG